MIPRLPDPQFWVAESQVTEKNASPWALTFKEITAPTNVRTMIGCIAPGVAFGNKVPLLLPREGNKIAYSKFAPLLLANLNSFAFDFVVRQKVHGQTLNLFILEQLPLIPFERFNDKIGGRKIADVIRDEVLHLTYTAEDMRPFARDMNYNGEPFVWDEEDRHHRMARLDALFFHLYGIARDDAGYILDQFPIVRADDEKAFDRYRTKDMILAYLNAIAAGDLTTRVNA